MIRNWLLIGLTLAFMSPWLSAESWPHWRGPTGNGVAPESTPPTTWSATNNVKWKLPIPGSGSGSPIVWEDRVFVVTAVPTGRGRGRLPELEFLTIAVDRRSGKELWRRTATIASPQRGTHSTNGFASASPCTDGKRVYAHFGSQGLYAYTLNGEPVWKRDDLGTMITRNDFGEGSSPVIAEDQLLVPWDHEGSSFLYAFDTQTGRMNWKTPRDEPTCWATPLVIPGNDGQLQVIMNGENQARAYDLETGRELWRCGGQTARPVATPVHRDGLVFIGSGFRGSFLGAFRLDGRGDIQGTNSVAWSVYRDTPDIASPLLSDNRLYFYKAKTGLLTCLNADTGQPYFQTVRMPDIRTTYASPVAAGGHVYLTGRGGTTVVIRDATNVDVISVNSVGEGVDATPAIADDQLFIRGARHLFCIEQTS
ncbi:MAG: PQQ-binding-like beta-propeller repeat protein [Planctomycetota bacterium]